MKTMLFFIIALTSPLAFAKQPSLTETECRQAYKQYVDVERSIEVQTLLWFSGDGTDARTPLRDLVSECYTAWLYNVSDRNCDLLKVEDTYAQFKKNACSYNPTVGF